MARVALTGAQVVTEGSTPTATNARISASPSSQGLTITAARPGSRALVVLGSMAVQVVAFSGSVLQAQSSSTTLSWLLMVQMVPQIRKTRLNLPAEEARAAQSNLSARI